MNLRIFQHTILELSYKMDSKSMQHTFEKFFFSIPANGHRVMFSSVGPFFEEGKEGLENFGHKLKFREFFN